MGSTVYANNNSICCKDGDGKIIASFPDVCLSPPTPPAGPIPIPYPVSSFSSDTQNGSTTVKIGGQPIMLKDKSYFSKCTGDEAATKTLGMGVISHNITGKVYFAAWSMDVKVEGLNVDRHLDLTTSNHMSPNANAAVPLPEMEKMSLPRNAKPCPCVYKRGRCPKTPNSAQHKHANQTGAKCWRPGCKNPGKGEFIADHQMSLNERWYKGGCRDEKEFCKNATATPGEPKGSKEYNELRSRCKPCYKKVYANIGRKPPKGEKDRSEGSMESSKSAKFRQLHKDKFGNKRYLKDC